MPAVGSADHGTFSPVLKSGVKSKVLRVAATGAIIILALSAVSFSAFYVHICSYIYIFYLVCRQLPAQSVVSLEIDYTGVGLRGVTMWSFGGNLDLSRVIRFSH